MKNFFYLWYALLFFSAVPLIIFHGISFCGLQDGFKPLPLAALVSSNGLNS